MEADRRRGTAEGDDGFPELRPRETGCDEAALLA